MGTFYGLLVEGVPGIGKSTLIDGLLRRHAVTAQPRKVRTLVHLAQTHTYGPLAAGENAGTLTAGENRAHLERIVTFLEWLRDGVRDARHPSCFVVIDTLHLTHCLRPGVLRWDDVRDVDRRLAELGCKLLLLNGNADIVRARTIAGRADTQFRREYACWFGRTDDEVLAHFLRERDAFTAMCERSAMERKMLANDGELEEILGVADGFWRAEPASRPAAGVR